MLFQATVIAIIHSVPGEVGAMHEWIKVTNTLQIPTCSTSNMQ